MANNFIQPGDVLDYTCAGTVTSGTPFLMGTVLAVPLKSGVSGDVIPVQVTGVFTFTKGTGSGTAIALGGLAYWDDSAKKVTGAASGNTAIGYGVIAAANADATCTVKLKG